uniref:Uncharacterized protein n=1 Tax=Globisporangium ultimum (strain ATCC 200006 / CBS 805.95 / DAOM BR144) TaxID=431595 RepID=K3WN88_GLOUD
MCQSASGVTMTLPLRANKKQKLCDICTELKTMTIQKTLPKCTVTLASVGTIRLQQEFNRLFNPCVSDDDDNTTDDDPTPTPTPAATTVKPVVVAVTQPPAATATPPSTPIATKPVATVTLPPVATETPVPVVTATPPPPTTPEATTPTATPAPTTPTPSTAAPASDLDDEYEDENGLIPVVVKDSIPVTEGDVTPVTKAAPNAPIVEDPTETTDDNFVVVVAPSPTPASSKPKRKDCDY